MYNNKIIIFIFALAVSSAAALNCLVGNLNDGLVANLFLDADVCVRYDYVCKTPCYVGPNESIQTAFSFATNNQIAGFESNSEFSNFQYCSSDFCMAPPDTPEYRSCYVTSITNIGMVLPVSKPLQKGAYVCVYYSTTDGLGTKQETYAIDTATNCEGFKSTYQNVLCCDTYFCNAPDKIVPGAPTVQVGSPTVQNSPASPQRSPVSNTPRTSGSTVLTHSFILSMVGAILLLFGTNRY